MKKRIVSLLLTLAMLMGMLVLPTAAVNASPGNRIDDSQVDSMLAAYNQVFNTMGSNSKDSMPLGNGTMAANVWVEDGGDLVIYLSRPDSYSEAARLLKIGRVRISAQYEDGTNVFASGSAFQQKLVLEEATLYITVGSGNHKTVFKVWIDRATDAMEIEAVSSDPVKLTVKNDLWRTEELVMNKSNERSFIGVRENCKDDIPRESADVIASSKGDDHLLWYHRNEYSRYEKMVAHQKMDVEIQDYYTKYPDPYLHNTFGALVEGSNLVASDGKTLVSTEASRAQNVHIYTHCGQTDTAAQWIQELDAVRSQAQADNLDSRENAHTQWWREFWHRSWMFITGDQDAYNVTQGYLLHRYQVACMANPEDPIHFNGGLFTMCLDESQGDDYRDWGSMYWHQNTRHVYWPMLQAGDFEFMKAYFDMYLDALPLRKEISKEFFGKNGAYYPEQMYKYGADGTRDKLQWALDKHADYTTYHWQNGFEALMMMFDYYEMTGDETMVTDYIVPIGQELMRFYYEMYYDATTGKLEITPSNALEQFWNCKNPSDHLAGLHATLPRLLALDGKFPCVTPALVEEWQKCYDALPAINETEDHTRYLGSYDKVEGGMNFENPELYTVFPYELATIDSDAAQLQKGKTTFENRRFKYDLSSSYRGCWHQDGSQAAMLGLVKEAKDNAVYNLTAKDSRCKFPGFWQKGHDEVPDYDNGGQGSVALQRMAMQSYDQNLYLLPAWPAEWDVDFCLHADNQAKVHVAYADGKITTLEIEQPEGKPAPNVIVPDDMSQDGSASLMTSFTLGGIGAVINGTKVTMQVPMGVNIKAAAPEITVSAGATVEPASGTVQDFTNPVEYTVTGRDGQKTVYEVTVLDAATETYVDNTDSRIKYEGTWKPPYNSSGYYGPNQVSSQVMGSSASLTFNGTGITYIAEKSRSCGMAEVYVDGKLEATVDAYLDADIGETQVALFSKQDMKPGEHTIQVKLVEGSASKNPHVKVDAFKITSSNSMPDVDTTVYAVTAAPAENGRIRTSVSNAGVGEVVRVTAEPAQGFALKMLTVTDADNNEIPVENMSFTMPKSNVTITAVFGSVDTANLAVNAAVTVSSTSAKRPYMGAQYLNDGDTEGNKSISGQKFEIDGQEMIADSYARNRWTADGQKGEGEKKWQWAQMTWEQPQDISSVVIHQFEDKPMRVNLVRIEAQNDQNEWIELANTTFTPAEKVMTIGLEQTAHTKAIRVFLGRDNGNADYNIAEIELYGASNPCVVHFNSNGGSAVGDIRVEKGSAVMQPEAPTRENFTFIGWFVDEACTRRYDFKAAVTQEMTLYVGWEKLPETHAITVDKTTNGTVTVTPDKAVAGSRVTVEAVPEEGYELKELVITGEDGKTIEQKDGTFVMPDCSVTIRATFSKIIHMETEMVDQKDDRVVYKGKWNSHWGDSRCYGGSQRSANNGDPEATASLTFTGTGIGYIGEKSTTGGIVDIYIDGLLEGTVDCYTSGDGFCQVEHFTKMDLPYGEHTIMVKRNPKSVSGRLLKLDAFKIYVADQQDQPAANMAPQATITVSSTAAKRPYMGAQYLNDGDTKGDTSITGQQFVIDGKTWTADGYAKNRWCVDSKKGEGTEKWQWAQLDWENAVDVNNIKLFQHDDKPARISHVRVAVQDAQGQWIDQTNVTFDPVATEMEIALPKTLHTKSLRVYVGGNGSNYDYNVAEIEVYCVDNSKNIVLTAGEATARTLSFTWEGPTDGGCKEYHVYVDGKLVGTTNEKAFTAKDLIPGTTYQIMVKAVDKDGTEYGDVLPLRMTTIVTWPSDLRVHRIYDTKAVVRWEAREGAASYEVSLNGTKLPAVNGNEYVLDNLTADTVYTVVVYAKAADGTELDQDTLTLRTNKTIGDTLESGTGKNKLPFGQLSLGMEYCGPAMSDPDYHYWCISPIQDKDGSTHIFTIRLPGDAAFDPGWMKYGELVHFKAEEPEGPYEQVGDVIIDNSMLPTGQVSIHNVRVVDLGEEDGYVILYITQVGSYQNIHMLRADSLDGPWRMVKGDQLIPGVEDQLAPGTDLSKPHGTVLTRQPGTWTEHSRRGVMNPDMLKIGDEYIIYFKALEDNTSKYGYAVSKNVEGPYVIAEKPLSDNKTSIEDADAFEWNGKYYLITTDNHGSLTGVAGYGVLWESEDGKSFQPIEVGYGKMNDYFTVPSDAPSAYGPGGKFERPSILMIDGQPAYFYGASGTNVEGHRHTANYVMRITGFEKEPTAAKLTSLTLSAGTLTPTFDADVTAYTATVENRVEKLTVTALAEAGCTVTINGAEADHQTVALHHGTNTITVVVTDENQNSRTYTVKVEREHQFGDDWKYDTAQHWHECSCGEKTNLAAHTWDEGTITKEPQVGVDGEKTFRCVCGAEKVEQIPALPDEGDTEHPVYPTVPERPEKPEMPQFTDVKPGDYFYDAVNWAVAQNITTGTGYNTFSPDAVCTRAQAVTFLWRAAGQPAPKQTVMPFTDVTPDAYYRDAVLWAVENDITAGTSATTFSPDAVCTRGQIVTFQWRAAGRPAAGSVNPFQDVTEDAFYADAVLWAVENDITAGTSATTFSPDAVCTRAQIVTFLYRAQFG